MPAVRKSEKPIVAVVCSDIHLSHTPPVARSAEPNWYAAMQRALNEVHHVAKKAGSVPIIIAGDIFDRWNSPPELINFAVNNLVGDIFTIPGQHDLPMHNLEDMHKSAYGVIAGLRVRAVCDICDRRPSLCGRIQMHGFPWGKDVVSTRDETDSETHFSIAIVHAYCWVNGFGEYPGVKMESNATTFMESLRGFRVAFFGDNHKHFCINTEEDAPTIFNCGTLMRRKMNEIDYKPTIGLLHSDGSVSQHFMDTSQDKFIDQKIIDAVEDRKLDMSDFLTELQKLADARLDFEEAIKQFIRSNGVDKQVADILLEAIVP